MFSDYLLALLFAHLAGDFVFQNESLSKMKLNSKKRIVGISIHTGIILVLNVATFILFFKDVPWILVFFLSIVHGLIDLFKCKFVTKLSNKSKDINGWNVPLFFGDQAVHAISIIIAANFLSRFDFSHYANFYHQFISGAITLSNSLTIMKKELLVLIYLCLATSVSNIVIKTLVGGLKKDLGSDSKSGRYIGGIERILTIAIILAGAWQALAALYGSKTAIRFEKAKDPEFAEYYILGTSLSALFGVLIAVAARITLFN